MAITKWLWKGAIGSYSNTKITKIGSRVYIKASNLEKNKYINVSYNTRYNTISVNKIELYNEDSYYDTSSFDRLDIHDRNVILTAIEKVKIVI